MGKDKYKEKGRMFDRSKVQMELICDVCNDHQYVYSSNMVRVKSVPKKYDVEELQKWSEVGYMCGSSYLFTTYVAFWLATVL